MPGTQLWVRDEDLKLDEQIIFTVRKTGVCFLHCPPEKGNETCLAMTGYLASHTSCFLVNRTIGPFRSHLSTQTDSSSPGYHEAMVSHITLHLGPLPGYAED